MRRWMVAWVALTLGVLGVLGLTGSAQASPPVTKSNSTTAEAFWHAEQSTGPNSFTETTWYVGVFAGQDGSVEYSDLYLDVESCKVDPSGNTNCNQISSEYGDSGSPGSFISSFSMDLANLSTASLDGTYMLQSYDASGNPVGSPESYRMVATWTGNGPLFKSHQKFSFHQKCVHFQATDKGKMRAADATGTLNGAPLGTTSDTFFGGDASLQVDHYC